MSSADTHGRWPWAAAALVAPSWTLAATKREALSSDDHWIAALALPILVSHQTEEWVKPGGFLPFCNKEVLGAKTESWPLTERVGFHVNVTYGWSTALAGALLWDQAPGIAAGTLAMEAGNAAMHIGLALRMRRYNPGVVTGVLLMATHALVGARRLRSSRRLDRRERLTAAAIAAPFAALPAAMQIRMRVASRRRR